MNQRIQLAFALDPDNGKIGVFEVRDYRDPENFVMLARFSCHVDSPSGVAEAWLKAGHCAEHHQKRLARMERSPNFKDMQTVAALLGYPTTKE